MVQSAVFESYYAALLDTRREAAVAVIEQAMQAGCTAEQIVFDLVVPAMQRLADSVADGLEVTLAQHFVASQIAAEVTDRLIPLFERVAEPAGCIVLGTSALDFHGLGKKIVGGCLRAHMLQVIDLGMNVSAERFVEAAVENEAQVIGVSSMMVHTARGKDGPSKVREILRSERLEGRIKLVVGGAPYRFHAELYKTVGADGWAENGTAAARVIGGLIEDVRAR